MKQFVHNLRREMVRQQLTATELAERAGMQRQSVSRILNEGTSVTLRTAERLAAALQQELVVAFRKPRTRSGGKPKKNPRSRVDATKVRR